MEWVEAHEAVSKCSPVNINPAYTIPQQALIHFQLRCEGAQHMSSQVGSSQVGNSQNEILKYAKHMPTKNGHLFHHIMSELDTFKEIIQLSH